MNIKITKETTAINGEIRTKGNNWSDYKAHLILVEQDDGSFKITKPKQSAVATMELGDTVLIDDWR